MLQKCIPWLLPWHDSCNWKALVTRCAAAISKVHQILQISSCSAHVSLEIRDAQNENDSFYMVHTLPLVCRQFLSLRPKTRLNTLAP